MRDELHGEKRPEPGSLAELIVALDQCLTGAALYQVLHTYRDNDPSAQQLGYSGWSTYYLSDGGYSRVFFRLETGRLCLTSNSRDEVKERWDSEQARELRTKIEAMKTAEAA